MEKLQKIKNNEEMLRYCAMKCELKGIAVHCGIFNRDCKYNKNVLNDEFFEFDCPSCGQTMDNIDAPLINEQTLNEQLVFRCNECKLTITFEKDHPYKTD